VLIRVLQLGIVFFEPTKALQYGLRLADQIALGEFSPWRHVEGRRGRIAQLFSKQVVVQLQVFGVERVLLGDDRKPSGPGTSIGR
jgi:hypothetical protein